MPEAKVYLELSRTSTTEIFREKFILQNLQETPLPESLFNKVTGLYSATSLKERTPRQKFSDEFCEILRYHFIEHLQTILFYK